VKLNNRENISLIQVAIGDKEGETFFSDQSPDDCQNSIEEKKSHSPCPGPAVSVHMTTLDAIAPREEINLLKIDVEGFEKFALEGGVANVLPMTECVYIESYEKHFNRFGYSTPAIVHILNEHKFSVYKFVAQDSVAAIPPDYVSLECENLVAFREIDRFRTRTGISVNSA